MEVYLVQHGEAKPEAEDPQRPLTDRGREEVALVANHIATVGVKVFRIYHSGRLRAKQTAEILAHYLTPPGGVQEREGLAPLDDPRRTADWVGALTEPVMLVGHLPHLSRLLSYLILGDPEREILRFRMGGIVCLAREEGRWAIGWALRPEVVSPPPQAGLSYYQPAPYPF